MHDLLLVLLGYAFLPLHAELVLRVKTVLLQLRSSIFSLGFHRLVCLMR